MLELSEFKQYLQISDTSLDSEFAVYEPVVAELIEKITGIRFAQSYTITTTEGSNIAISATEVYDDDVYAGASITCANFPSNTKLWDWTAESITFDKKATVGGSVSLVVAPIPEALKIIAAKMVLWDINNSTTSTANQGSVSSKSMGVLSVSYDKGNSIDSKYGYPRSLIGMVKRFARSSIDVGRKRYPYTNTTNRRMI